MVVVDLILKANSFELLVFGVVVVLFYFAIQFCSEFLYFVFAVLQLRFFFG